MRKIIIIIVFLFASHIPIAQIDIGNYTYESDYLIITDDSLCFELTNYGCFFTHIRGCGVYQVIDKYLFIETKDFHGEKSSFEKLPGENNFSEFSVTNPEHAPFIGVNIICKDSMGATVNGAATNKEGLAKIAIQQNIDFIRIAYLGCDGIEFKFEPGFDYQVNLVEGNVTEHQTVVFEIMSATTNNLSLALLNTDFKTTKDTIKILKRTARQSRKHNHSINELEKTVASRVGE